MKLSRLGRIALRTKRELLDLPDSAGGSQDSMCGGGAMGVASSQSQVHVEIVTSKLVTRKIGEGRREREKGSVSEMTENGLKNFKRFRKVHLYTYTCTCTFLYM